MKSVGSIVARCSVLLLLVFAFGCNDRRTPPVIQLIASPDAGMDASEPDRGPDVVPDVECLRRVDGQSCMYRNGTGVCVERRCQLVACQFGFADCNGDRIDGCETATDTNEACGSCDNTCESPSVCQGGRFGYTCGAGVLCAPDGLDLDFDINNGCEWRIRWDEPVDLIPGNVDLTAAGLSGDTMLVAGTLDGTRFSSTPVGFSPLVSVTSEMPALAVSEVGDEVWSVWPDALVAINAQGEERLAQLACDAPTVVAADGEWIATEFGVYQMGACGDEICPLQRYERANYLAAFATASAASVIGLQAAEMAGCDVCVVQGNSVVEAECVTPECAAPGFDASICAGCAPTNCPDFRPVDVFASRRWPVIYVATARGLIVLNAADLSPLARAEFAFEPGVASGARFIRVEASLDGDGDLVFLASADAYYVFRFSNDTLTNVLGETGYRTREVVSMGAAGAGIMGLGTAEESLITTAGPVSGRVVSVVNDELDGVFGSRLIGVSGQSWGLAFVHYGAGRLYLQRVERR